MKSTTLVAFAAAVLALAACKEKASDLQNNVEKAGAEIKDKVGSDPDVKEAGRALKNATKDSGKAIKQVAAEAKDATDRKKGG